MFIEHVFSLFAQLIVLIFSNLKQMMPTNVSVIELKQITSKATDFNVQQFICTTTCCLSDASNNYRLTDQFSRLTDHFHFCYICNFVRNFITLSVLNIQFNLIWLTTLS